LFENNLDFPVNRKSTTITLVQNNETDNTIIGFKTANIDTKFSQHTLQLHSIMRKFGHVIFFIIDQRK